jgi:hypothetical protein
MKIGHWHSGFSAAVVQKSLPAARRAASLIEKETDERRTSNIERPTSNNVFFRLKKTEQHAA